MAIFKKLKADEFVAAKISSSGKALTQDFAQPGDGAVGTGLAQKITVAEIDGLIQTKVFVDLKGLAHSNVVGDAIGLGTGGDPAYLFKWNRNVMGSLLVKSELHCLLKTAGTNPILDIDILSATKADLAYDGSVSGEADDKALFTGGGDVLDVTGETHTDSSPVSPDADGDAVYITVGGAEAAAGSMTDGKFVITFYAYPSDEWVA